MRYPLASIMAAVALFAGDCSVRLDSRLRDPVQIWARHETSDDSVAQLIPTGDRVTKAQLHNALGSGRIPATPAVLDVRL